MLDRCGVVQTARCGDYHGGEGLQKETAQTSSTRTNNGVTKHSEAVLFRGSGSGVAAKNPGDDLNEDIRQGPRHLSLSC